MSEDNKNEKELKEYDDYVKEREVLSKLEDRVCQSYEKTLVILSSGFLAFSLSFLSLLTKISGKPVPLKFSWVLFSSWVLFAVCIIFLLAEFVFSAFALRKQTEELEKKLMKNEDLNSSEKWAKFARWLFLLAGVSFVAGMIALIIFAFVNLKPIANSVQQDEVLPANTMLSIGEDYVDKKDS